MAKTEQSVLENHHQINQLQSRFGGVSGSDAMLNQCFFTFPRAFFPGILEAVLETHQQAVPSLRSTRNVIFCAAMGLHKERVMCFYPASDWADIAVLNGSVSSRGRSQSVGTPPYSSADSHLRLCAQRRHAPLKVRARAPSDFWAKWILKVASKRQKNSPIIFVIFDTITLYRSWLERSVRHITSC